MAKHILKLTDKKVAVKVNGTDVTETITLASDCKLTAETIDQTQSVSILSITWMGAVGAYATITRGTSTVPIAIVQGECATTIDFVGSEYSESVESTEDIKIVTSGDMQVYLLLRKDDGYATADPQQYTTIPY